MDCTNHPVAVVVSNTCSPSVKVPAVVNLKGIASPVNINFNLSGLPDYCFPTTSPYGIVITETAKSIHPASTMFSNYIRVSATEVSVDDANHGGEDYNYAVTVITPDGKTLTSDPIIRNRR